MQENRPPASISIGAKILMIALSFSLPIGVLVYQLVDSIDANISVADAEKAGNAYLRPLEETLQKVQDHEWASWQCRQSQTDCGGRLAAISAQVNTALEHLRTIDARYGHLLKFTPEELKKRGREHQTVATIAREWAEMAASTLIAEDKYGHFISDLLIMITHAGDTSNLILDPDLDSYYLMDATLIALPQTQDRMARVALRAGDLLAGKDDADTRLEAAVDAAALQGDLEHVLASSHTTLTEDPNFYGESPLLAAHLEPAMMRFDQAAQAYEELVREASRSGSHVDLAALAYSVEAARRAAFDYWRIAVDELDALLDMRIRSYAGARTRSLVWSGIALAIAGGLAFFLARSITRPLASLMRSLGPGATLLGECVGRISEVSQGESVDPVEAKIICGELDAHAASMRMAVAELARHVSGAKEEPVHHA